MDDDMITGMTVYIGRRAFSIGTRQDGTRGWRVIICEGAHEYVSDMWIYETAAVALSEGVRTLIETMEHRHRGDDGR